MDEFLKLIAQSPLAVTIIVALIAILAPLVMLIYLVAFLQGREISFWPPKIGQRAGKSDWRAKDDSTGAGERRDKEADLQKQKIALAMKGPGAASVPVVTSSDILVESDAQDDCELLTISRVDLIDFVLGEATRHPWMFTSPFSSIPLIFSKYVLLLSWDGSQATIERVLDRETAYPVNDAWFSCVSLYRQATALPYRIQGPEQLVSSTEARRSLSLYRRLVRRTKDFLLLQEQTKNPPHFEFAEFEPLINEAESALLKQEIGIGIARMEALLSAVHKLLLRYAPQTPVTQEGEEGKTDFSTPKPAGEGAISVLCVEDHPIFLRAVTDMLVKAGFRVSQAGNSTEAMSAMVEYDYDVVIADLMMMGDSTDGREVAIAAKTINPKAKVLLLTAFFGMTSTAELLPYDGVLDKKETSPGSIITAIHKLLEE